MRSDRYRKKNNKKRSKLKIALIVLLIAAILAGGIYAGVRIAAEKMLNDNLNRKELEKKDLSIVDVDGYVKILLLGTDARTMDKAALESSNSDCIIIVSINTKTNDVNLISIYRDTYLPVSPTGYGKINSALSLGGPEATIRSLNETMDLNISNYVLFNWKMVADLVDEVGGIDVDLRESERVALNKYRRQTAKVIGAPAPPSIEAPGPQILNGVQAVTYGRIRKGVGDDFKRTDRMRYVIDRVLERAKKQGPTKLLKMIEICMENCETSLPNDDIIGLVQRLPQYSIGGSTGYPYTLKDGMIRGGAYIVGTDLADDAERLHAELFGQTDYRASAKVLEIAQACWNFYNTGYTTGNYGTNYDGYNALHYPEEPEGEEAGSAAGSAAESGAAAGSTGSAASGSTAGQTGETAAGSTTGQTGETAAAPAA